MTKTQKAIKEADQTGAADELHPRYALQGLHTDLLLKLASGEISGEELARRELASRGQGKDGRWVGFPQAEAIWQVGASHG